MAHDDALVGHGRYVGASGSAAAEHNADLGDSFRRHAGLVVEDATEVVAVGEDLVLQRQVGAARVDQVDAGQAVGLGDLLGAQMLLDGDGEVGAALDRGVVGDNQALAPGDTADAGDQAGGGSGAVVHVPGSQLRQLQKWCAGVEQLFDAFARQQLAAVPVALTGLVAATLAHPVDLVAQIVDEVVHLLDIFAEDFGIRIDSAFQLRHGLKPFRGRTP